MEARTPLQEQAPDAVAPAAVITDGPTLFNVRGCEHCHEIRGTGGHKGPDLSGVGRRLKKDVIQKQIVDGGESMPAFGDALPAQEITALVNYLHKQKAKTPAWPKGAPAAPVPPTEPSE